MMAILLHFTYLEWRMAAEILGIPSDPEGESAIVDVINGMNLCLR